MFHQTPLGEANQVRWRGWIMYQAKGNKKRRRNFSLKSKWKLRSLRSWATISFSVELCIVEVTILWSGT
jgi:hypothetical protein